MVLSVLIKKKCTIFKISNLFHKVIKIFKKSNFSHKMGLKYFKICEDGLATLQLRSNHCGTEQCRREARIGRQPRLRGRERGGPATGIPRQIGH
jgi:hypothetical protein